MKCYRMVLCISEFVHTHAWITVSTLSVLYENFGLDFFAIVAHGELARPHDARPLLNPHFRRTARSLSLSHQSEF